jgi:hypothetical protein
MGMTTWTHPLIAVTEHTRGTLTLERIARVLATPRVPGFFDKESVTPERRERFNASMRRRCTEKGMPPDEIEQAIATFWRPESSRLEELVNRADLLGIGDTGCWFKMTYELANEQPGRCVDELALALADASGCDRDDVEGLIWQALAAPDEQFRMAPRR